MIDSYQKTLLKDFSTLLDTLVELSVNVNETSSLPKLEVSLRSGQHFTGSVIGLKKSTYGNLVMLIEQEGSYSKAQVHLIQCQEITALSFVDPDAFLAIFSEEKESISELELKRKTKSVENELEHILSKQISISLILSSISESKRNRILEMIEALPTIFSQLIKDEMGKQVVASSIQQVTIEVAEKTETVLDGNGLKITFAHDFPIPFKKEKEALLHSIEQVL